MLEKGHNSLIVAKLHDHMQLNHQQHDLDPESNHIKFVSFLIYEYGDFNTTFFALL